jgi:hypothetical protein
MIDDSDIFRLWADDCVAIGSFLSVRGEPRLDAGDDALKGLVKAEGGVGSGILPLGDLRRSIALNGVVPPEVVDAGVVICDRLAFEFRMSGAGEVLRSTAGDLGGTCGRVSSFTVAV